jgi:acyl-CoA synthetase (AMP-forming)/AMP-acid ligase II
LPLPEDAEPADLAGRLAHWARRRPEATAFTFLHRGETVAATLSYAALHARALAIMSALRQRGLAGRTVLLLYSPGLAFIEAFCGCLYAGAIAVPAPHPVNARATARIAALAQAACVAAVLTERGLLEDTALRPTAPEAPWLATDAAAEIADASPAPIAQEAPAFLQFTSGTTGGAKGVVVTRSNLAANQAMIAAAFGHDATSRGVTWLPLFHDMGLVGTVLQAIWLGAACAVMSPYAFLQKPVRWLRAIGDFRATTSGAPGFAFQLCLDQISRDQSEGIDLSSWQVAFCGAEPVRAATLRRFAERFAGNGFAPAALFPCYGLAEATLFATGGPAGAGLRTRGAAASCGRGWGAQRLAIVEGEIWLAGPHVAQGYWRDPEATQATFGARLPGDDAAWLRTGDLGFVADGELFVTGRIKDLIIVRGQKHHPEAIEATIAASDPALTAGGGAAFVLEDDDAPRVVVVQETARGAEPAALARIAAGAVNAAHGFLPEIVLVRAGSLPRTTSGKVRRHEARADYLAGRLIAVAR